MDRLRTLAKDFVTQARADGAEEHDIEESASDRALRRFSVRAGEGDLTSNECQHVRDVIMTLVS